MNHSEGSRHCAVLGALFAVSVTTCLVFAFSYPLPDVRNDAVEYLDLARNVAAGAGFTQDGVTPAVYRPPLFSTLLGIWFRLSGTSSVLSAAVFQSLLHGLAVVAAFSLFLELCLSLSWAAGAAAWLAINPILVSRVVFVLQEPTVLLFTTAAVLCSVRLLRRPSVGRAALAGCAWGACTLAKSVSAFAPLLLLAMWWLPERMRWRWRGREAAALLLCFGAAIAPWTARNFIQFHRFIPVNAQAGGMLVWNVLQARIPGEPPGSETVAEVRKRYPSDRERTAALWDYVARHPRYFLVDRTIRNVIHFAGPPRDWWIARGDIRPGERRTGFWVLAALFHIPLYLFLLARTAGWARSRAAPAIGFPVLFYWAYWAEHAVVWGDPRFGLAVYPVLVAMVLPIARAQKGDAGGFSGDGERAPG